MKIQNGLSHFAATPLNRKGGTPLALREQTLGQLLLDTAATHPQREAVVYPLAVPGEAEAIRWTWSELSERARRLASGLKSLGILPGAHVAIWAPNLPDWITIQWACAFGGYVLVCVNPLYRSLELAYVLRQSEASVLFYPASLRGTPIKPLVDEARAHGLPKLSHLISIADVGSLLREVEPPYQSDPSDVCMIQYTSGTTGFPKGAMLTHRGLINNALAMSARRGDTFSDRIAHGMPFFHTGGCVLQTILTAVVGSCQVCAVYFDAAATLQAVERERCTQLVGVPTMLQAVLEHPSRAQRDLSTLRGIGTGGAPVPIPLVQRAQAELSCPITIVYGQTEASPVMTQTDPHDPVEKQTTTVGYPLPHLEIKIIHPTTAEIQPLQVVGEVCGRGYSVMRGYHNHDSDQTLDSEGWLHTGDLGIMDADGYVNIVGRLKDMVIRGGENIYPVEVENVLLSRSEIADAQVIGVPDSFFGEELCAVLRLSEGSSVTADEVRAWLGQRLARYKVPRYVHFVKVYPLTASGKVQKFRLREQMIEELGLMGALTKTA